MRRSLLIIAMLGFSGWSQPAQQSTQPPIVVQVQMPPPTLSPLDLLTAATLVVLIYYARETYKLRKTAEQQVEAATTPIVVFQSAQVDDYNPFNGTTFKHHKPVVRNLGQGAAFNVIVTPFSVARNILTFQTPLMLAPGQQEPIIIWESHEATNEGETKPPRPVLDTVAFQHHLQFCKDRSSTKCVLTYSSASGKLFQSTFTLLHGLCKPESFVSFDNISELSSRPSPTPWYARLEACMDRWANENEQRLKSRSDNSSS